MISRLKSIALLILGLTALFAARPARAATPMGTAFTYQGRLTFNNLPATGLYDFQFTLKDAASGGATIGSVILKNDLNVQNGLFTTELDFGAAAYNGDARWLAIGVRNGSSTGAYTALGTPQPIEPTPYASFASVAKVALSAPAPPSGGTPQLVRTYPVATGQTVAAGNVVTIASGKVKKGYAATPLGTKVQVSANPLETPTLAVAGLSPTGFMVAYVETGSNTVLRARLGTINGNAVTLSAPSVLYTALEAIDAVAVTAVSSSKCVAVLQTTTGKAAAMVVTFPGAVPTAGTPAVVQAAGGVGSISIAALSSSQVIFAYRDGLSSNNLSAQLGAVSGTALTVSPKSTMATYQVGIVSVQKLTADKVIFAFNTPNSSSMGWVGIGTISGAAVTFVDWPRAFDGSGVQNISMAVMDETRVALVYESNSDPHSGYQTVVMINGTNLYIGQPSKYDALPTWGRIAALTASQAMIAHIEGNPGPLIFQTGAPNDNGIEMGAKNSLNEPVAYDDLQLAGLSSNSYVSSFFINNGGNLLGYVMVGNTSAPALLGIARAAGTAGQNVAVTLVPRVPLRGFSDTHTGLVAGQFYYAQSDGSVSATETAVPLGLAISATELMLVDQ